MNFPLPVCLGVSLSLVTSDAFADHTACFDAAIEGQRLNDEHRLIEAREKFRVCAQQECPTSMQSDCAGWLEAVEKSIVTVVLVATDATGTSLFDVKVRMDGQPLLAKLDGQAIPVNPGLHTFHFERADGTSAQQTVQANEGDRNQKITVVLTRAPAHATRPLPGPRTETIVGLTVGAAGFVGIILGSVFGALTASNANKQKSDCPPSSCSTAGHAEGLVDHSMAIADGSVSTAAFIAGGALVLSGALIVIATGHTPPQPIAHSVRLSADVGARAWSLLLRQEF
ncbi:MAG: hypothetical protein ABSC94_12860 [Polyangiaceae bacterium]